MKQFFAFLALAISAIMAHASDKPNIVFFFADDQTTSTLGAYGNTIVQTPNLDRLADEGTLFRNAFVSQAICWVSRTTILTGLVGRSYGTPGNPDLARADAVDSLYSDILRENGYRTGYFGKWHAKMPDGYRREDHFDEFEHIFRNPFYKEMPDGSLRHETELIVDKGIEFIRTSLRASPSPSICGSTLVMRKTAIVVQVSATFPGPEPLMGCTKTSCLTRRD